jgi:hypothetical protein
VTSGGGGEGARDGWGSAELGGAAQMEPLLRRRRRAVSRHQVSGVPFPFLAGEWRLRCFLGLC